MRVASVGTAVSKYGQDAVIGQNLTKVPLFFSLSRPSKQPGSAQTEYLQRGIGTSWCTAAQRSIGVASTSPRYVASSLLEPT